MAQSFAEYFETACTHSSLVFSLLLRRPPAGSQESEKLKFKWRGDTGRGGRTQGEPEEEGKDKAADERRSKSSSEAHN